MGFFNWLYTGKNWRARLPSFSFMLLAAAVVVVSAVTWTWPLLAIIGAGVILERVGILPRMDNFFRGLFMPFRWLYSKILTTGAKEENTEILADGMDERPLNQQSDVNEAVIENSHRLELELLLEELNMLPESIKVTLLDLYATQECQAWLKMQENTSILSLHPSHFYKPKYSNRARLEIRANNALCVLLSTKPEEQAYAESSMQGLSHYLWEKHPEIHHLDFSSVPFQGNRNAIQRFQPLLRQLLLSNPSITKVTFHPGDSDLSDTRLLVDALLEPHKITAAVNYCVHQNHSGLCSPSLWQQVRDFVKGVIQRALNSRASLAKSEILTSSESLQSMVPPEKWTEEAEAAATQISSEESSWGLLGSTSSIGSEPANNDTSEITDQAASIPVAPEQKEEGIKIINPTAEASPLVLTQEVAIHKPTRDEITERKKALAEKIIARYVQWDCLGLIVNEFDEASLPKEEPTLGDPIFSQSSERLQEEARNQKAKEAAELAAREIIQLSLETNTPPAIASLDSQLRQKIRDFSPEVLANNKNIEPETLALYTDAYYILNNILSKKNDTGMYQITPTNLKTRTALNWAEKWLGRQDVRLDAVSEGFAETRKRQAKNGVAIENLRQQLKESSIRQQAQLDEVKALWMEANGCTEEEFQTHMARAAGKNAPPKRRSFSLFGYLPLSSVAPEDNIQKKISYNEIASVLLRGYAEFSCQHLLWDTLTLLKNKDHSLSLSLCAYQFTESRIKLHRPSASDPIYKKVQHKERQLNAHIACLLPYFQAISEPMIEQQREARLMNKKFFLLYLVVSPAITALNFEHIRVPTESLDTFHSFLENILTFNPHITHIVLHRDNEASFPDKLQTKLEENRQWQAASHYAKMSSREYQKLKMPFPQETLKEHLRSMAKAYLETSESLITMWLETMRNNLVKVNSPQIEERKNLDKQVKQFFKFIHDIQDNKKDAIKAQKGLPEYAQSILPGENEEIISGIENAFYRTI